MSTSSVQREQTAGDRLFREHRGRAVALLLLVGAAAAVAASDSMHALVERLVARVALLVGDHLVAGAVAYVLLSAASAMLFFFSTAVITPLAVEVFGPLPAVLLLWLGWVLGGVAAYAVGRFLGRRVATWFVSAERLQEYEARAARLVAFRHVLLFQLAVPSEVPGYVLGLAGCRFRRFLAGMALAELPFAVGAVFLGESFLRRNLPALVALGVAGVVFGWLSLRWLRAQWSVAAGPAAPPPSALPPAGARD
jgi:uncharacterized membrane protein YdjX (TVP38/TMEM64 family)